MKLKIVLLLILLKFSYCASTKKDADNKIKKSDENPTYGPFHETIIRSEPCSTVSPPYERSPRVLFFMETYNTTDKINLLRGNFTTLRTTNNNHWLRFRGFQWKQDKWQLKYKFNNIPCDGIISSSLMKIIGLKLRNTCYVPQGKTFSFEGLDYDQLDHLIWSAGREYGRLLWIAEAYTKKNTIICWETELLATPLQTKTNP